MVEVVIGIISRPRDDELEYLLVSARKDFGEYTGHFYPPGGHIETGESVEQALVREVAEEVGLSAVPVRQLDVTLGDVPDQITYWWECKYKGGDISIDNEELLEAKFCTESEMMRLPLWPATRAFFTDRIFKT